MALSVNDLKDELDRVAAATLGEQYADSEFRDSIKQGLFVVISTAVFNWLTGQGSLPGAAVNVTCSGLDSSNDTHNNVTGSGVIA